ncbi:HAD domain-containing protein [Actinomadura litoris]|uniref:HAD domain-containing protein n=1 Tax=Actinomadura litoris TaxID=2678616 RepID=UPI001FA7BDD5|nr:HAD domain-containing protein [Actinomadura litoris]
MTGTADLPVLFLDVDGPLIPFGAARPYPTYPVARHLAASHPLLNRVDPGHGPRLAALRCRLVWATTWMSEANECLCPLLGLPPLEVVIWPETAALDESDARRGMHWKTRPLVAWAAGRPFVWVDDEITPADRSWVAAHHEGKALLHRVDPREGLTGADYSALHEWLRRQGGPRHSPGASI